MLQLAVVRERKEEYIKRLEIRGLDGKALIEEVLAVDDKRKALQTDLDKKLAEANSIAKQIGMLFKEGKAAEADQLKQRTAELKEENKKGTEDLAKLEEEVRNMLYQIPNAPSTVVPKGKSADDNEIVAQEGAIPQLNASKLPHWELAAKYDIIDFELGVKITGAGFPVYKGKGARLQRALINFFLDEAINAGYHEIQPPLLINEDSGIGTGQLPDKEGQMYHTEVDHLYLIPTAEVPVTNIYRDVIVKEDDFPIKNCGYTPCFRREAGSYGKDVRGLNRLHQFDKVEIVQIAHPDSSYQILDQMVEHVKGLLRKLELPYRVAKLCGGDMGFTSALTFDMEVFSAAQEKWLEVSSISNFETFQANRLRLRYKGNDGKTHLAHTLNGSALALPRIVASLLENNQTPEGIKIPAALVKYTGFDIIN